MELPRQHNLAYTILTNFIMFLLKMKGGVGGERERRKTASCCTCWLSQTLPGERLPLLPLIQLPHGVVPHGPPLLCGGGGGGGGAEGPVVHRPRHAADAVGPHHAVAGQRAIALWVAGNNLGTVAGHVPG